MNTFRKIFSIAFGLFVLANSVYSQSELKKQEKTFFFQGMIFDAESLEVSAGIGIYINQYKQMKSDSLGIFYFPVSLGDTISFYVGKEKNCTFVVPEDLANRKYIMAVELDKKDKEKSEIYFSEKKQEMPLRAEKPVAQEGWKERLLEPEIVLSVRNVNEDITRYFETIGYKKLSKEVKQESIISISEQTLLFFEKEMKKKEKRESGKKIEKDFLKRNLR